MSAQSKLWIDVLDIVDHDGSGISVPKVNIIIHHGGYANSVTGVSAQSNQGSSELTDQEYKPPQPPPTPKAHTSGISLKGGSLKYLLAAISLELAGHMYER